MLKGSRYCVNLTTYYHCARYFLWTGFRYEEDHTELTWLPTSPKDQFSNPQGLPLRCSFAAVNELLTKEFPCPPPRHGSRCPLKRLFFNPYTSKITRSGLYKYSVELPVKPSTCSVQWELPQNPHPLLCSESSGPKPTVSPLPFIWWDDGARKILENLGKSMAPFNSPFLCSRYGLFKKKKKKPLQS